MFIKQQILILFLCFTCIHAIAQKTDHKIPKRAGIYSAIIPGAGQVYTKKYWKVPIIYAGLITSAYYIKKNNDSFLLYKGAYLDRLNGDYSDEFQNQYSDSDLKTLTDYYRRNREVSILLFTLTYLLNIVDASVNAHLLDYDISDNLSINIKPEHLVKDNISVLTLSLTL